MNNIFSNKETIEQIAQQYDTPFYLYDAHTLEENYFLLRDALPKSVDIFYSIKANPNIAICASLKNLGACAELCSWYEIQAALKAGFEPDNIIFVGPAKSDREILKCLELGVYAIVCESLNELDRISKLAKRKKMQARVALRINPNFISKTALLKMGGKASQFGMDEDFIRTHAESILNKENVNLIGIHVYNGTRILHADTVIENTTYVFKLAEELSKAWKIKFEMIDIGGGLGVPYFDNEDEFNIEEFKEKIKNLVNDYLKKFPNTRIILESGRFLVAKCGMFISKIIDIKNSKDEIFAITDGGTNCHMAAVGVGSLTKRNFPITAVTNDKNNNEKLSYNITGPLCTPGDLVGKQVLLPKLAIDDYIIINNSGAYGPTASPVMFLSHGFPAEILYKNSKTYLIRERFNEEEFINKQFINI